ncbi:hypothetical protein [Zhouia amylolytica]|uniref:Glycine zipper domain-containing protein n=1 Tax=Zhouia amylolytica AD3 TaxID=1286632 RepID=W2UKE9_9FLAO|nr:hypothetical protein [Zhouia amylolytica]ETN94635.1 hypothetical protein P278_25780 [Zhouia amylolytica AD3]
MKFFLLFFFVLTASVSAQNLHQTTGPFIRVFNLDGQKIANGKIVSMTTDTLRLYSAKKVRDIPLEKIGLIKTKRAMGHTIGLGAAVGCILGGVAAYAGDDGLFMSRGEFAVAGGILGAAAGTATGSVIAITKKRKVYVINGDKNRWELFRKSMSSIMPKVSEDYNDALQPETNTIHQ